MTSLVSGVMGALVALVLVTAWNGRTSADERSAGADGRTVRMEQAAAPVNVQCAPGQRAVVRQIESVQGPSSWVECVGAIGQDQLVAYSTQGSTFAPQAIPAVSTVSSAPQRVVYREPVARRASSGRSWQKTALIIGGSAGAGAGVGAIAGGKKGALIGAAIGGGAASLYEAAKRR